MSFTSACYTPDELIQKTDYIIRGKITKLKEKTVTSVETTGNEKKYNIDIPYCIYEVEITENLKMPIESSIIELVFVEGTDSSIEAGKEYVFFLEDNKKSKVLSESFSLSNIAQGVYAIIEQNDELQCISPQEDANNQKIKYEYLKQKCKEPRKE